MQRSILSHGKKVKIHVEYTEQQYMNSAINVIKKTLGLIAGLVITLIRIDILEYTGYVCD